MANIYECIIAESLVFKVKANNEDEVMDYLLSHSLADVLNENKNLTDEINWDEQILSTCSDWEDADIDITEEKYHGGEIT